MPAAQIVPMARSGAAPRSATTSDPQRLALLRALERKVLWLSSWMIHHANQLRSKRDGLKVGGHQASSASSVTLMTALYFHALRAEDRVAVKPHASPVFHAIQYLLGRQTVDNLQRFRALGGAQSYPSRTKDIDDVDLSTGSVGLGVATTLFASIVQDYVHLKKLAPEGTRPGRMVAIVGDAEFDEGNVFEAMLEGWKHDVRNLWWVIDYNRQSLDSVVSDQLFKAIEGAFEGTGWRVVTLKYGKRLEEAFRQPGGAALRRWIDECPNAVYSALTYKGGAAWREHLRAEIGNEPGVRELLARYNDDDALHRLMTNLAGHDLESIVEAFAAAGDSDVPTCFIAYTIKGFGLPFAGHKDNHAGIMSDAQMAAFRDANGIAAGQEWERFAGLDVPADEIKRFLAEVPFARAFPRRFEAADVALPPEFPVPRVEAGKAMSTQEGFGRILFDLAGGASELAARLVTTSPDVTVSTNLGGWVNRRGLFDRREKSDVFKAEKVVSAQTWAMSPDGQHIELGIAENNLFLLLAAAGLAGPLFGARLLPVGTLYDPFIERGLDALNYACYQDARFMIAATPSGITLAPEGGAHQSLATPLIGIGQPGLSYFEPAFIDELAAIMEWGFGHMQAKDGGSVYLRLSTRPLPQPERSAGKADIVAGAYWVKPPSRDADLAIVYVGAVAPEAFEAHRQILEDIPGAGLLAVTSPDRLHADWTKDANGSQISGLLAALGPGAGIVSVIDGHPATLSWLGAVRGHRIRALGVDRFGQSGDIPDLYRVYGLDSGAILDAAAALCLGRRSNADLN
jgi:pyruvate dehydrogenase E1 component